VIKHSAEFKFVRDASKSHKNIFYFLFIEAAYYTVF